MAYKNAVGLIGCGWLGTPLASQLVSKGYRLHITTRDDEKAENFKQLGYTTYLIDWDNTAETEATLHQLANNVHTLIFALPPAWNNGQSELLEKIALTQQAVLNSRVKNVLFLSSIGVYGEAAGIITEKTQPVVTDAYTQLLVDAEKKWTHFGNVNCTIVRLGGLIGVDRHPVYHLVKKSEIPNPATQVNLIHQADAVGLLTAIIENKIWGETYNLVTPYHPSRKEYYTEKATQLGLILPPFTHHTTYNRVVLSDKILQVINYRFLFPLL